MKLSISLPDDDIEFLDAYAESEGLAYGSELAAILAGVERPAVPLGEAPRAGLRHAEIRWGRVAGRSSRVAVQHVREGRDTRPA